MNRKLLWGFIALATLLLALATVCTPASAGTLALPPRPTPVPTATPIVPVYSTEGSFIRLRVDTPFNGAWTSVEWQDAIGNWHPVEGWQGTLEPDGTKTWWVVEADRGKGPFRWVLDDRRGGKSVGISSAFNLPSSNRQVVEIKLTANR